jgi:sec-independent protein translocase protein TatA
MIVVKMTQLDVLWSWRPFMIEDLLQPRHLLVILAVALFLFGPKKLPELGKGLAEGIRGFKDALKPGDSRNSTQA